MHELPILLPVNLLTSIDLGKIHRDGAHNSRVHGPIATIGSGHVITALVNLPEEGWGIPGEALQDYEGPNPFVGIAANDGAKSIKTWSPQGFWKHKGEVIIRVHVKPWRALFALLGSKGAPGWSAGTTGDRGASPGRDEDTLGGQLGGGMWTCPVEPAMGRSDPLQLKPAAGWGCSLYLNCRKVMQSIGEEASLMERPVPSCQHGQGVEVVIDDESLMGDDRSIQAPKAAGVTSLPGLDTLP